MRRTRSWLVCVLALIASSSAVVAPAAHAATRPGWHRQLVRHARSMGVERVGSTREFDQNLASSGFTKVTSSTGQRLYLDVYVDQYGDGAASGTDLEISVSARREQHLWDISVSDQAFEYDSVTGQGRLRVGSDQLAPYGSVSLDITPAGHATTTQCPSGGRRVVRPVTMRGTVDFGTRSAAWGHVGDPVNQIVFTRHPTVESDFGKVGSKCAGFPLRGCHGQFSADRGGRAGFLDLGSFQRDGVLRASLFFDHSAPLAGDLSGSRDDFAFSPLPKATLKHPGRKATLAVDAGAGGVVSGTATWAAVEPAQVERHQCRGGTTKVWNASYTNGANPLTIDFNFGGIYTYPDEPHGAQLSLNSDHRGSTKH